MDINNFVFLGVGNTAVMFDSVGGVVADFLRYKNLPAPVFGGVDYSITTNNIVNVVNKIRSIYPNKKIVVIDSTLKSANSNISDFVNQKLELKQGKVKIANINYECGDYYILCETFNLVNGKIYSAKINEILTLSSKISGFIFKIFNV